ncbi:hypothetical protein JFN94_10515 [Burkholderia anthina]|uniref:Uncharacterized protein n=1 Tax=Burkholderia anthina TaxID=179879 RepID=A0A7T6VCS4_9BURK|nr:hypothetical protein [Burkholderia anthina]QQK01536.1 hypothetical protein JFN94_10515 [Burkholderia anthina]
MKHTSRRNLRLNGQHDWPDKISERCSNGRDHPYNAFDGLIFVSFMQSVGEKLNLTLVSAEAVQRSVS